MGQIGTTAKRSNWRVGRILTVLGLKMASYLSWKKKLRTGHLEDKKPERLQLDKLLPEEERVIIDYALCHPRDG